MKLKSDIDLEGLLDTLKNGSSQKIDIFVVLRLNNGRIEVRGYISYDTISEIPKETIKDELQKVKCNFDELISKSQSFKNFALEVGIDFSLDLDYGGGSILICNEKEGVYKEYI
jgi:hypothetical protein